MAPSAEAGPLLKLGISTIASLAAYLIERDYQTGLWVNSSLADSGRPARILPGAGVEQLMLMLEALAKVSPLACIPFESFLEAERVRLPFGSTLMFVVGHVTAELAAVLHDLRGSGTVWWSSRPATESDDGAGPPDGRACYRGGAGSDLGLWSADRGCRDSWDGGAGFLAAGVVRGLRGAFRDASRPAGARVGGSAVSWMAWAAVTLVAIKVLLFADSHWSDPIWLTALPAGLAGVLGRFDPVLLICCGSALVWWLGRRLAYMRPGFARVVGEFQFGLVLLATTFSLAYLLDREPADAIAVGLTYVTLGLVGAAVAQGGDGQEGRLAFRQQGSWWGMLLVSVTAILVLGLLVGAIITPDFVHLMVRGLAWLWRQVDGVLMAIADRFASEPLGPSPGTVVSTTTTTGIAAETLGFGFSLPGWLTGGARLVWTMLVAGMGLLAVWRVASYLFGRMSGLPANGGGEVERLKGAFRLDMAAWFKRTVTRLLGLGRRRAGRGRWKPLPRVRCLCAKCTGGCFTGLLVPAS